MTRYKAERSPKRPESSAGFAVLFILCGTISLLVVFWPFFGSHFDKTAGDAADGRLQLSLLQHWVKVFHHQAPVASPNFFYPQKGVLGYTDTFLGLALPHALFRSLGVGPFLAVQFATMLAVALGFVAMYLLMRGGLRFPRSTALIGSTLFIISNMYYIYVVHAYILVSVITAPVLFLLIGKYWEQNEAKPAKATAYLSAAALLLALTFYTSYYIAWFVVLCSATVAVFYLACCVFVANNESPLSQTLKDAWQQRWSLISAGVVFLVSMVPFFALYLPVLHRTGKRNLGETLLYLPRPVGVFDVGKNNLVWGRVSARIEDWVIPGGLHEHPVGWPLLTVVVFLVTSFYCGAQLLRLRRDRNPRSARMLCLVSAIALTCLTLSTAGMRLGSHAPVWWLLTKFVPGAAAIRIPQRIDLVLNIGVVIVCMFGFEILRKKLAVYGSAAFLLLVLLAGGLGIEQLNTMATHLLSRKEESATFANVPPPPKSCSSFYISNWSPNELGMLQFQTSAVWIAQRYNIPTLNGTSSWYPPGWDLMDIPRGHVSERAIKWAKQNAVSDGLCALDLASDVWKPAAVAGAEEASATFAEPVPGQVTDSGFESGDLGYWTPFLSAHATIAMPEAHSGTRSMAELDGEGSFYQDVPGLQPGHRYRVTAWVSASAGADAGAYIAVYDLGANVATFSATVHPDQKWQMLSHAVTVSDKGVVRIHLFRTKGTGTIYWDDVRIQPDPGNDSNNLPN
jgi:hypothetical protein